MRGAWPRSRRAGTFLPGNGLLRAAPDPLLPALVDLLLPQRHLDLQAVDRVPAGRESVVAMRCRDGDDDARLADRDTADPVVDGDAAEVVPALQLVGQRCHDLL